MNNEKFVEKAIDIAKKFKTIYIMGCFGAPMNEKNKKRYTSNNSYNKKSERAKMINSATDDTFGFDCVCLIKGILWGWSGDKNKIYGGATYPTSEQFKKSTTVQDFGTENMKNYCTSWSNNFNEIEIGEVLYLKGHAGIYIGDGLAVECTPKWKNGVQITAVGNIGKKDGYETRNWTSHGKLKYISYENHKEEIAIKPIKEYKSGIYETMADMRIRKGPGTNYSILKVKECTKKMQNALTSKFLNADAVVEKGTKITALEIIKNGNQVWMKNYSGYICIKGSKEYCKFIK